MKIIVQKYGGTSVASAEKRKFIIEKVKMALKRGEFPIVVVSAMGRKGAPYATDTLLSLVDDEFKKYNLQAVDLLLSCGEAISTVVMCNELYGSDVNCVPVTGGQAGIITDDNFGNAKIVDLNPSYLYDLINKNIVPVVAGFQGISKEGRITTIGRGGSDVTAAIIGAAVKADRVEIYKDVDGIMTSDPRIVPEASLIKNIGYNEIFQFAHQGAKVIHPRAVEIAQKYDLTLLIKNTTTDSEGTLISRTCVKENHKIITGITSVDHRIQVRVKYNGNDNYYSLFTILGENGISLDLINVFPKEKIFTIDGKKLDELKSILEDMKIEHSLIENCSKIAVIGAGMKGEPGVMARILMALTRENIEVLQTADSHITIWCLVKAEEMVKAIKALHKEFEL